jgi:hypothetical protein
MGFGRWIGPLGEPIYVKQCLVGCGVGASKATTPAAPPARARRAFWLLAFGFWLPSRPRPTYTGAPRTAGRCPPRSSPKKKNAAWPVVGAPPRKKRSDGMGVEDELDGLMASKNNPVPPSPGGGALRLGSSCINPLHNKGKKSKDTMVTYEQG